MENRIVTTLMPIESAPLAGDAVMPVNVRHVAAVPRLSSRQLLAGALEVEIDHEGAVYRLRLTALGKLILTK